MKNSAVRMFVCAVVGMSFVDANSAQAARLFGDTFENGTVGANIGAPWGANQGTALTATYSNASNPFPTGGNQYADMIDNTATNQIRLVSNASNNNGLSPSINEQVSTYSFEFVDLGGTAVAGTGLIFGYYRQQANVDLNGAGRSYSGFLHTGNVNPAGTLAGGAAGTYTPGAVHTVFLVANDSASTVTNYAGSGRDLAPTTADVWIASGADVPTYLFSANKQNAASGTAVSGVGFRSFSGDQEHFAIDNVLLQSGASFDRTAVVAFPTFVVHRDSGEITVENASSVNFNLKGYTLSSTAGALNFGSWASIADTGDSNSGSSFDGTGVWLEASSVPTQVAESTTGGGGVLAGNGSRSLGDLWARTPYQDLVATYVATDGSIGSALVTYSGAAPLRSDFNGDDTIDAADWILFGSSSGASFVGQTLVQSYVQGDVDGDLDNDFADFRLFKADYVAIHGEAAFSALVGVPEPSTLALFAIVVGFALGRRHRKSVCVILTMLCASAMIGQVADAATPITYKASGDPGLFPDSNGQVDDAWFTSIPAASGSGFFGFPANGIPDSHWILFSTALAGVNGSIQADHAFDSPLTPGQAVRLDFANSSVAVAGANPAGVVGVSLTSGGNPVATFKFTGGDTLYRYDDAGVLDESTGAPFAFRRISSLEFRIDSASGYTAAYGNANGSSLWSGTMGSSPIDGIRVFNTGGGNGSDVIFDNLTVGATTIVPLTLEVNKSTGEVKIKGNATLAASIDYYQITSAGNALNFSPGSGANQWNSLDLQNLNALDGADDGSAAGDSPTEGWDRAPNASKGRLAEYFVRSGGSAAPVGGALTLGRAYDNSVYGAIDGDLAFSYGIAGSSRLMSGVVSYVTSGGVIGDYSGNGVVDAADYTVWRNHLGQVFDLPNRDPANGNLAISSADYASWKSRFGDSGSGALSAGQVPEPKSIILLVLGVLGFVARRRLPAT